MSPLLILGICTVMVGTSFLSGVFGMAGGMVLIGVLLTVLPVPTAMALHAVTQIASNGWRALLWWRHVRWRIVAAYVAGCAAALAVWSVWLFVPSRPLALLFLGVTPFLARLIPEGRRLTPDRFAHGTAIGVTCMSLLLLTGVAGPLLDQFFLGGSLERRQIIATKGMCQIFGHGIKPPLIAPGQVYRRAVPGIGQGKGAADAAGGAGDENGFRMAEAHASVIGGCWGAWEACAACWRRMRSV